MYSPFRINRSTNEVLPEGGCSMHVLAAQALAAAVGSDPAFLDAIVSGRGRSVTCGLDGAPQAGAFIQADGVLFEHVAVYSSGLSASGLLRWDKRALVLHVPEDGQKPFRVHRVIARGRSGRFAEVTENVAEYFNISVALRCAARLENIK